jgi:eukaryotic-like serine/threonine-protein kinase
MFKSKTALLTAGLSIASVFIFSVSCFSQQSRVFENTQLKYSVKYPAEFQTRTLGRVIVFVSPQVDKKTGFSDSINIAVETLSDPAPKLEELFNNAKGKLTLAGGGAKILEEKKDKLGGADAYRLIYTSRQKKTNFKFLQVISVYKNNAYVVTYTALQDKFDRDLNLANSIVKSFKFTD